MPSKCKFCFGYGLWGIGDPCPIGPSDAASRLFPTVACPECGANSNPVKEKGKRYED